VRNTRALWASLLFVFVLATAATVGLLTGALRPILGLDLQGGVAVILSAPDGTEQDVMERALENIRNRVDAFGVGEPDIFLAGSTIEVQIPGTTRSTVETRAETRFCLVGATPEPDAEPVIHGCADDRAAVEDALAQLEVTSQPSEVCLVTGEEELGCYDSRGSADAAQFGLTVAPEASPSPTVSPGEPVGPAPPPERYCITDPTGAPLACFDDQAEAEDAVAAVERDVRARTFCLVDSSEQQEPSPPPDPEDSPSPSPSPTGLQALDLDGASPLPCQLEQRADAEDALDAVSVERFGTQYCVVSAAEEGLGCYLTEIAARARQQETGQQRLLQVIGETARLEERSVLQVIDPQSPEWATTPVDCELPEQQAQPECEPRALEGREVVYFAGDGSKLRLGPVIITGANISRATATLETGGQTGVVTEWAVQFELDREGADAFGQATTQAVGAPPPQDQIAIVVDRVVISSPQVREPITNGVGVITGGFAEQDAKDLATQLNAGALPVELTRESVRTVSPTLGDESLRQAIRAGGVGLILLFLYLLFYYRLLGVVASVGMATWAVLALGLVGLAGDAFGYALTLAGVAGLLISLGVTADSYIVFFERIKDEVRHGRSVRASAQPAFKRALRTIIAADIVTGIAAGVLYLTAVSSVRGFALTLGVATALDLFVVWFYKRPAVFLLARSRRVVELPRFGLLSGVAGEETAEDRIGGNA
jgi:protein-export membrane protein SecD